MAFISFLISATSLTVYLLLKGYAHQASGEAFCLGQFNVTLPEYDKDNSHYSCPYSIGDTIYTIFVSNPSSILGITMLYKDTFPIRFVARRSAIRRAVICGILANILGTLLEVYLINRFVMIGQMVYLFTLSYLYYDRELGMKEALPSLISGMIPSLVMITGSQFIVPWIPTLNASNTVVSYALPVVFFSVSFFMRKLLMGLRQKRGHGEVRVEMMLLAMYYSSYLIQLLASVNIGRSENMAIGMSILSGCGGLLCTILLDTYTIRGGKIIRSKDIHIEDAHKTLEHQGMPQVSENTSKVYAEEVVLSNTEITGNQEKISSLGHKKEEPPVEGCDAPHQPHCPSEEQPSMDMKVPPEVEGERGASHHKLQQRSRDHDRMAQDNSKSTIKLLSSVEEREQELQRLSHSRNSGNNGKQQLPLKRWGKAGSSYMQFLPISIPLWKRMSMALIICAATGAGSLIAILIFRQGFKWLVYLHRVPENANFIITCSLLTYLQIICIVNMSLSLFIISLEMCGIGFIQFWLAQRVRFIRKAFWQEILFGPYVFVFLGFSSIQYKSIMTSCDHQT